MSQNNRGEPMRASPYTSKCRAEELLKDGVLSVPEAAGFMGLSRATVYRLMENGQLVFVLQGRRRLVPRRAVVRLLAAGLRGGRRPD
jgi:excisionase family DNA binding protein